MIDLSKLPHVNEYEYEAINTRKGMNLLQLAMKREHLPTRSEHFSIACRSIVYEIPGAVLKVAGEILWNSFTIVSYPVSRNPHKFQILKFTLLDILTYPGYLLCHVMTAVIKTVSAVSGILFPSLAARGWIVGEKFRFMPDGIRGILYRKLIPSTETTSVRWINPWDATRYIGKGRLLKLHKWTKSRYTELKQEEAVKLAFISVMKHLNENQEVLRKVFEIDEKTPKVVADFITRTKELKTEDHILSSDEIREISEYFGFRTSTLGTFFEKDAELKKQVEEFRKKANDAFKCQSAANAEHFCYGAVMEYL